MQNQVLNCEAESGSKSYFQKPLNSRLTRDHHTGIFRPSLAVNRLTPNIWHQAAAHKQRPSTRSNAPN